MKINSKNHEKAVKGQEKALSKLIAALKLLFTLSKGKQRERLENVIEENEKVIPP